MLKKMKHGQLNELILALYLGHLALSKYFINILPINSFLVLLIPTAILLLASLLLNVNTRTIDARPLIVSLVTSLILLMSVTFFYNDTVLLYAYNFLLYGFLPLYFLSRTTSLGDFFKYFAYVGVATVLLLGFDPLAGYPVTTDYMVYGYYVMLPAFISLYIARKYLKMRWLIIFELISFALILVFANRGASLAALSLVVLSSLVVDRPTVRRRVIFLGVGIVSAVVLFNATSLLEWGIDAARDAGHPSYALEKIHGSLDGSEDGLSGRDSLWGGAIDMFSSSPIIGHGIAAFEQEHGIYAHNLILEVAVSFGLLGLIIFSGYSIHLMRGMFRLPRQNRLSYVLGFSAGIVPLIFSMQPFIWYFFWLFALNPARKINVISEKNSRARGDSNE